MLQVGQRPCFPLERFYNKILLLSPSSENFDGNLETALQHVIAAIYIRHPTANWLRL
jgi:hypothetical protein